MPLESEDDSSKIDQGHVDASDGDNKASNIEEDIKEHADEFRGEWLKIDRAIALNLFKHIVSNRG